MKYLLLLLLTLSCGKEESTSKKKIYGRIDITIHIDVDLSKVLPLFEEECFTKYESLLEPEKTEAIEDCLTTKINAVLLYIEEAKKEYENGVP